jgi:hypothetical protein
MSPAAGSTRSKLRRGAALLTGLLGASLIALPATPAAIALSIDEPLAKTTTTELTSLVRVSTPTRADKDRLNALGLDLTEHAGEDFVEVVLHGAADNDVLQAAGLAWTVEVADMAARERDRAGLDAAYAASVDGSPLPSGRESYRTLADYNAELTKLAADHPGLVKGIELPEKTIEGRTVRGIEITRDVEASDGKPVFLLMGLHHAREWPSGELAMEFAQDLVGTFTAGDARTTDLLSRARVLIVPVVNADGFEQSRRDGSFVDLREVDDGSTVAILGTPGAAYKRKNCRPADGIDSIPEGACAASISQGGFGNGVDLNRNYGGLWGGPGAAATPEDPTYRGASPFSEPESRNVQQLISSRQVTTLISNHTFTNLVLRPPGVRAQGPPPDEDAYEALGARMAGSNGYKNQPSYALYDTTGTTEDWSYYATGGLGFTFEIGDEFHPPFEEIVGQYLGLGAFAGKGNRQAYYEALTSAADPALHSVLAGKAPAGAELTLVKEFSTLTSPVLSPAGTTGPQQAFTDRLESSLVVGRSGRFTWHVNPSTRPAVMAKRLEVLSEPLRSESFDGGPTEPATGSANHEFVVTESDAGLLRVDLTWPTPDDYDLEVYLEKSDGTLEQVASSGAFLGEKETAFVEAPVPGTYVLRAVNFASTSPTYTMTATLYGPPDYQLTPGLVEQWTLICSIDGAERSRQLVTVDRGSSSKVDLQACKR